MKATRRIRSLANGSVGGLAWPDLAAAVALASLGVYLTGGSDHHNARLAGVGPAIGVLAMTVPVAWRRRAPLAAAAALAGGAVVNPVVFGSMIRCGAALPAVFLVGYTLGREMGGRRVGAGVALCAANVVAQTVTDPALGAPVMVLMIPTLGGFFATGRLVRSRTEAAASLRARSAELRLQREQTARMAVMADRARVADDLDAALHGHLDNIASTAATGRAVLEADPAEGAQALVQIEHEGRGVLQHMREVVGTLQDAPTEPQPTLAALPGLLDRATTAEARLTIEGFPRSLAAGLELSGYRIIEQLLTAFEDAPGATVEVRLRFSPDALELAVSGPPAHGAELRSVLATARERASLHGGTVEGQLRAGLCELLARLPLVSAYG